MSGSIPVSALVSVTPSVLSAGGSALSLSGVFLTENTLAPLVPTAYSSPAAVSALFGPAAIETQLATQYFLGYQGGTVTPAQCWFMQVPTANTPAQTLATLTAGTPNFCSFMTTYIDTPANIIAYAAANNGFGNKYLYVAVDGDATAITSAPPNTNAGVAIKAANDSGTALVYNNLLAGAFLMGAVASLNFNATNGRATMAYRAQSGVTANVTKQQDAANLIANGYNFYGEYSLPAQSAAILMPGQVSGPYLWIDSYVDQIYLNSQFQSAMFNLLLNVGSIPYNSAGYTLIEAACADVITQAGNFGIFRPGVTLSAAQVAEVNNAAGADIASTLQTRGWYLQIKDATAQVRAARQSPPMTFWFQDGESVQTINLASVIVQ